MADPIPYAIISTAGSTTTDADGNSVSVAAGTVVNVILWDGVSAWEPPAGTETRADPAGALRIGQAAGS